MVFLIIFHRYLSHHDQFLGSNSVGKHRSQMADPYLYLHRFVFGVVSLSIAALNITRPAYWFMAIFFVAGFRVYNQLFFMKNRSWVTLTPDTIKRARTSIIVYGFLLLILLRQRNPVVFISDFNHAEVLGCVRPACFHPYVGLAGYRDEIGKK